MNISSDFDSGNIEVIDASNPQQVLLAMRPDLNSHHFQWFHFKVDGLRPGQHYAFSLSNAGESAYNRAWSGYHAAASYDRVNWFRVPSRFEQGALQFAIEPREAQVWFAYFEPYSRERHAWLIEQALSKAGAELFASGTSIEGRAIELLRISRNPDAQRKVWISPSSTPANTWPNGLWRV
jgi:murein tripeptide amidase MpaA